MSDEYLWDKTGAPDPEVEHLERVLGEARFDGPPPEMPVTSGRPGLRFAVAAAVLIGIGALTFGLAIDRGARPETPQPGWAYMLVPVENGDRTAEARTLVAGDWIETDATTRADLTVADIGRVDLDPDSRLQLVRTGDDEHRLRLERGRMQALVDAPPRLFVTETPAGDAVDLGCLYTLEVDEAGNGLLVVEVGMVMYERGGYEAFVPAKARCEARKDKGMGTPYFETASGALRAALRRLDFGDAQGNALSDVIEACTVRDTLTLWNLLQHPALDQAARGRVLDRIEAFKELPDELTRDAVLDRDAETLLSLRDALGLYW
ncbi:MAG: FecR family protein [Planctomycetota bacterium]|nr:FecR family protein [Planctomycetota bacterium]